MTSSIQSQQSAKHVAILGAGAVGLTLAAYLRHAGHRVTLAVRGGATVPLPLRFADEIGGRKLVLDAVEVCDASSELPRAPDLLIVCTRGEQIEAALLGLCGHLDAHVPITIAAATLDDLQVLADRAGLSNPILRMGVAFATWSTSAQHYRVFSLMAQGSAIAMESGFAGKAARDALASMLTVAGLPARTAPTRPFRWVFRTILATEVGWLLSYRRAGWDLEALVAQPELLRLCGQAMREGARLVRREGGPVAWLCSLLPTVLFTRVARNRARNAGEGFREIWRHHGPKTNAQLDFLTRQLFDRAKGRPLPALSALRNSS